jgi:hypothetical protein
MKTNGIGMSQVQVTILLGSDSAWLSDTILGRKIAVVLSMKNAESS